jgi:Bacterial protein of unknown function (DUF899)
MWPFRGVRRRASWRPTRPVTPEVAGSSPVAPVKVAANQNVVLSVQTPDSAPTTQASWRADPKRSKTARNPSPVTTSSRFRPSRDRPRRRRATTQDGRQARAAARRGRSGGLRLPGGKGRVAHRRRAAVGAVRAPGKDSLAICSFVFLRDPGDTRPGPADDETARLPLAEGPCPSSAALLDQLDGAAEHATQQVNLAVVAKPPLKRILTFAEERGWRRLRLLSSVSTPTTANTLARPWKEHRGRC